MKALGERLRTKRQSLGLSQENVAEFLSISHTAYGNYERGYSEPALSQIKKISTLFKCSFFELIAGKEEIETLINKFERKNDELIKESYWQKKYYETLERMNQLNQTIVDEKDRYIKLLTEKLR